MSIFYICEYEKYFSITASGALAIISCTYLTCLEELFESNKTYIFLFSKDTFTLIVHRNPIIYYQRDMRILL